MAITRSVKNKRGESGRRGEEGGGGECERDREPVCFAFLFSHQMVRRRPVLSICDVGILGCSGAGNVMWARGWVEQEEVSKPSGFRWACRGRAGWRGRWGPRRRCCASRCGAYVWACMRGSVRDRAGVFFGGARGHGRDRDVEGERPLALALLAFGGGGCRSPPKAKVSNAQIF